jgi:uncharacterized protein (TIGR02145 family)
MIPKFSDLIVFAILSSHLGGQYNVGATNTTIFSALAGGGRDYSGNFGTAGAQGVFWTSSVGPNYNTNAYVLQRLLFNYNTGISRGEYARTGGMSVRIVKD